MTCDRCRQLESDLLIMADRLAICSGLLTKAAERQEEALRRAVMEEREAIAFWLNAGGLGYEAKLIRERG